MTEGKSTRLFDKLSFRAAISLVIALGTAFSFYAIVQMVREFVRINEATLESFNAFLSSTEHDLLNLVAASFAAALGVQFGLRFFGQRTRFAVGQDSSKMRKLIHWNSLITWSLLVFLHLVFLTTAFGFSFISNASSTSGDLLSDYFWLIAGWIVFYFLFIYISIISAVRMYKKPSLLQRAGIALTLALSLFGLSRFHFVDHTMADDTFYSNYPAHRYDYALPESSLYEVDYRFADPTTLSGFSIVGYNDQFRYFDDKDLLDLDEMLIRIRFDKERFKSNERLAISLGIDKRTPIHVVEQFRQGLADLEIYNVKYKVAGPDGSPFAKNRIFRTFLKPKFTAEEENRLNRFSDLIPNQVHVQLSDTICVINGELTPTADVTRRLRQVIDDNVDHLLNLKMDPMTSFERYLWLMTSHRKVIFDLRLEYAESLDEEVERSEMLASGNHSSVRWGRELKTQFPIRVRESVMPLNGQVSLYNLLVKKRQRPEEADKQWELIKGKSSAELHEMGMDTTKIGQSDYAVYSAEKFLYKDIEGLETRVFYSHRFGDERGKYVRIINERGSRDILLAMKGGDSNSYSISTEFVNDSLFVETRIDSESIDGMSYADTTISVVKYDQRLNFTPVTQASSSDGE